MTAEYWLKQTVGKPLFPDIEWSKPEQLSRAGKLAIIGGTPAGFIATSKSYQTALSEGIGKVRVIMPDSLKKLTPPDTPDITFSASNPSGGFSKEALPELCASLEWADAALFIGDAGKNSETAIVYETLLRESSKFAILTRDAIDLQKNSAEQLLLRENTALVASFAQLRSLLQAVYYPKILTLSMPLRMFVDAMHKVTITYPTTIATLFNEQIIVAYNGQVSTTTCTNAMRIWSGEVATKTAAYLIWSPHKPFEAVSTSVL